MRRVGIALAVGLVGGCSQLNIAPEIDAGAATGGIGAPGGGSLDGPAAPTPTGGGGGAVGPGAGGTGCGVIGGTRCASSSPAVEVCTLSGDWVVQKSCPSTCTSGACVGACTDGDKQCGSDQTAQTCQAGEWVSAAAHCPYVCTGKGVCSGECMPGTRKCGAGPDSLTVFECDEKGQWQKGSVCPNLCSNGSCAGSCVPGKARCAAAGNGTEVCGPMGTWEKGPACQAQTCVDGACAGSCEPNQTRCGGSDKSQPQRCDDKGSWVDGGDAVCCGDGPGQRCCDGHTIACKNNCGTGGTKTCSGGSYGACSTADTCCGDPTCRNKCGDTARRSCNGTSFGGCPLPNPDCCPDDKPECKNKCGIKGFKQCVGGRLTSGCSSDSASCDGREGFPCRGGRCDNGLFCCDVPGFCNAQLDTCLARRGVGGTCSCDGWCKDKLLCSGDEDSCITDPGGGLGQPCSN